MMVTGMCMLTDPDEEIPVPALLLVLGDLSGHPLPLPDPQTEPPILPPRPLLKGSSLAELTASVLRSSFLLLRDLGGTVLSIAGVGEDDQSQREGSRSGGALSLCVCIASLLDVMIDRCQRCV